jgi:hypothetical protein
MGSIRGMDSNDFMCSSQKPFQDLKMFWFGKYRIKFTLCKLAHRPTSQILCSIVFSQQPPNMCHLPVRHCTDPFHWGCIFKCVGYSDEEWFVGSRSTFQHVCLWRMMKMEAHCHFVILLWIYKILDLCNLIYIVILILLQWLLYFVLWCY